ncbi:hypothetical protein FACS189437_05140 [Bacteroidia bacterium]|nr:hypothetical protein FACS189437_05140 [Bacteroidia bacterium]
MKRIMNTVKLVGVLMLVTFGLYSCENEESEIERQSVIFPLNVGNSWTYETTTYNMNKPETNTFKMEIKNLYTIDGQKGFSSQEYIKGKPISLLDNDNEGNCMEYLFNNDKLVHKTTIFKKNVKKGDKWIYKSAVYTNDDYSQYEIEEWEKVCSSSDTVIVTPKGSFRCVGFTYHIGGSGEVGESSGNTFIEYLSENIGRVKYLHYEHFSGKTVLFNEMVLTDYSLK